MEDQAEKLREIMRQKKNNSGVPSGAQNENSGTTAGDKHSGRKTRIITITSGKGGVGKSNLSVNMAIAFARLGKKVIVMDADLGLANVNVLLKMIPKYNLYHVVKKQKSINEILVETEYGISILAGASGFSRIVNLGEEERQGFISDLETLSFADIIIIDTSAGVSSNVMDFIAAADDAVIITTPETTAIADAYSIIKIIAMEYEQIDLRLRLVVNRAKSSAEGKSVADRLINIVGQFLNLKIDYLGFIYEDPAVGNSVRVQKPFIVTDPKGKASVCIQHLAERMIKNQLADSSGVGTKFKKLFGRPREE
jgi:flagellar biosynthesis protein FlhG